LAAQVPKGIVVGLDASQGMIDTARQHEGGNVRFVRQDILALDFREEFDVVFSNAALHWVKDHRALLGRVHRSLRAGGTIRFNFAGQGNCAGFLRVLTRTLAEPRFSRYFEGFEWPWYMPSEEEYGALVREFPFRDVAVWGENADRFFPDAHALIRWIDQPSLVPFLPRVAEADRRAFRALIVQRMIQETRQEDSRCFERFRRINVAGKK
jgi:trans-aconitate methyltransferase